MTRPATRRKRHVERTRPIGCSASSPPIKRRTSAASARSTAAGTHDPRFANALDRLQPVLLNHATDGETWAAHGVTADRVRARNSVIAHGSAGLWAAALADRRRRRQRLDLGTRMTRGAVLVLAGLIAGCSSGVVARAPVTRANCDGAADDRRADDHNDRAADDRRVHHYRGRHHHRSTDHHHDHSRTQRPADVAGGEQDRRSDLAEVGGRVSVTGWSSRRT